MKRDFKEWLSSFRQVITSYDHFVNYKKVFENVNKMKVELNILNSLIGSKTIEDDFDKLIREYPQIVKCLPVLLAVREMEIYLREEENIVKFNFKESGTTVEEYKKFMAKTGLFDLIQNHIINNLVDYVTGVEVGLGSNGRKNSSGKAMELLIEKYLIDGGFDYYKEVKTNVIEQRWGFDLSALTNSGSNVKQFDFVVKTEKCLYVIETNFYSTAGSKLNETARSYERLYQNTLNIENFKFIWFTDGIGWYSARNNLQSAFELIGDVYNLKEINDGVMKKIFL